MKQNICVVSPKCCNLSAKNLAGMMGVRYISADGDVGGEYTSIFNYGSSRDFGNRVKVNPPSAVSLCVNKISTLKRVKNGVQYTKDPMTALTWLKEDGVVVCREFAEASKSKGVVITDSEEEFRTTPARFWTRYFEHDHEVRVMVYKGEILSVHDKQEEDGCFKFVHVPIEGEHKQVTEMIESVTNNIGIEYYGMDILVNSEGKAVLLEINSGPILLPETEKALMKKLKKEFNL